MTHSGETTLLTPLKLYCTPDFSGSHVIIPCCFGTSFLPIRSQLVAPKTSNWPLTLGTSSFCTTEKARNPSTIQFSNWAPETLRGYLGVYVKNRKIKFNRYQNQCYSLIHIFKMFLHLRSYISNSEQNSVILTPSKFSKNILKHKKTTHICNIMLTIFQKGERNHHTFYIFMGSLTRLSYFGLLAIKKFETPALYHILVYKYK